VSAIQAPDDAADANVRESELLTLPEVQEIMANEMIEHFMTAPFWFGVLIGAFLAIPVLATALWLCGVLTELVTDPKALKIRLRGLFADCVFLFTPSDWVWMSSRYKRRQFYERWRTRSIELENQYTQRRFERITEIKEKYT